MRRARGRGWIAAACGILAWIAATGSRGAPVVELTTQTRVDVTVHPLTATLAAPETGPVRMTLRPGTPEQSARFAVRWPDAGSTVELLLRGAVDEGDPPRIRMRAEARLPEGVSTAERTLDVDGSGPAVFEVLRRGGVALTLAVEATASVETVVAEGRLAGAPVQLRLAVEEVAPGQPARALETTLLRTFVGDPVSYSFRHGSGPASRSAVLRLLPVRIVGEIVQVDVELSGSLPGDGAPELVSRREQLVVSRGASAAVPFGAEGGPIGYRFVVTPEF